MANAVLLYRGKVGEEKSLLCTHIEGVNSAVYWESG